MKIIFSKSIFSVAILFASTIAVTGQSVSGSIGGGGVTKGQTARGAVVLKIPGGLHANSSRPGSEYAIPTTVRITGKGVKVSGVTYPSGKNRKFSFAENILNVYEGRVSFPFSVTVPANYALGVLRLNVSVRYQTCNDEVCYPPETKQTTITARVN